MVEELAEDREEAVVGRSIPKVRRHVAKEDVHAVHLDPVGGEQGLHFGIGEGGLIVGGERLLRGGDIGKLLEAAGSHPDGAILAAPVRDTLKRADGDACIAATEPRERLWRALTPQAFRRGLLREALEQARADGVLVTDEAMAVERLGRKPRLVEGREDNLKVTTPADLALAEFLLARAP